MTFPTPEETAQQLSGTIKRKRQNPHVEGNFNTFVFIPVQINRRLREISKRCFDTLRELLIHQRSLDASKSGLSSEIIEAYESNSANQIELETKLHVSLSKPLLLRYHFINRFVEKLQARISSLPSFELFFEDTAIDIFANETYERFFSGISFRKLFEEHPINALINAVDEVMQHFGFPGYYEKRNVHISLASTPENLRPILHHLSSTTSSERSYRSINNTHIWNDATSLIKTFHLSKISAGTIQASADGLEGSGRNANSVRNSSDPALAISQNEMAEGATAESLPLWISVRFIHVQVGQRIWVIPLTDRKSGVCIPHLRIHENTAFHSSNSGMESDEDEL